MRDFIAFADQRLADQKLVDQSHVRFLSRKPFASRYPLRVRAAPLIVVTARG
jgi:hypothetical protein